MQPSLGSIRRFVIDGTCPEGEEAFAIFHDDGSFSMERIEIPLSASGIEIALYLAGLDGRLSANPRERLAHALSLDDDPTWVSIISTARDRGDDELVSALLADKNIDLNNGVIVRESQGVSVDEILRLL